MTVLQRLVPGRAFHPVVFKQTGIVHNEMNMRKFPDKINRLSLNKGAKRICKIYKNRALCFRILSCHPLPPGMTEQMCHEHSLSRTG